MTGNAGPHFEWRIGGMYGDRRLTPMLRAVTISMRLCLVLSLWQAPVPWLHHHGAELPRTNSAVSADELRSHLAIFHSSIDFDADQDFGWHCHWVMPFWSHALDETSDSGDLSHHAFAFDAATVSPTVSSFENGPVISDLWTVSISCLSERSDPQLQLIRNPRSQALNRRSFSVLRC